MAKVRTADYDYELPAECIANNPMIPRDHSRLLVYDSLKDEIHHKRFFDICDLLRPGDCLVVNRSKVIPARIEFDGSEIFLLKKVSDRSWSCLVRPGKRFFEGVKFDVRDGVSGEVESVLDDGSRVIKFFGDPLSIGKVPLPPYIKGSEADFSQYQTVYASEKGSVAAPTAGLHFTDDLISRLRGKGVLWEEVLLHVGRGTFMPVKSEFIQDHVMHKEFFEFTDSEAKLLNEVRASGGRIVAVGTTSVRVLESCFVDGEFKAHIDETGIFIFPGSHDWNAVDSLVTNFHLPKSTLLMLVASFLEHVGVSDGRAKVLDIYEVAKREGYRFYSFGDAMIII